MSEAAAVIPGVADEPNWQRLHPATLALAIVKLGPRSLNFLPAVAALGFTGNWIWIVPAIVTFLGYFAARGMVPVAAFPLCRRRRRGGDRKRRPVAPAPHHPRSTGSEDVSIEQGSSRARSASPRSGSKPARAARKMTRASTRSGSTRRRRCARRSARIAAARRRRPSPPMPPKPRPSPRTSCSLRWGRASCSLRGCSTSRSPRSRWSARACNFSTACCRSISTSSTRWTGSISPRITG